MHRTCTRKGRWACYLASSATIPDVAECCGASFRFTRIFSDVLELDFYTGAILAGQMLLACRQRGAGAVFFPRKKNSLPAVHSRDDDAVSGHDVVAVSGVKPSGNAGQTAGSRFARNFATFSVFIMYRFFRGIPENVMEAARMDGAENSRFFCGSAYRLKSGHPVGTGIFVLDCFSMLEQPMTFLKTKSLWPLSLFLPEITSQNAGFSLCASLVTILPAMFVFLAGQDYLEQGIAMAGAKE